MFYESTKNMKLLCGLAQFVKSFFIFLHSHEHERNNRTARLILTRPITLFSKDSCEIHYEEYLTPYANKYVQFQIVASKQVVVTLKDRNLNMYEAESNGNKYIVFTNKCTCINFTSMLLPCKHIFATRLVEKIKLFDKSLCNERWSKEFYIKHQRVAKGVTTTSENISLQPFSVTQAVSPSIQTVNQKRKKALFVTNSLANLASLSSGSSFSYKMKILEAIETAWRQGHEVALNVISSSTDENTDQSIIANNEDSNGFCGILSANGHDQVARPKDLDLNIKADVNEILVTDEMHNAEVELVDLNEEQNNKDSFSEKGHGHLPISKDILDTNIIADEILLIAEMPNVEVEFIDQMEDQNNTEILSENGHGQLPIPKDSGDSYITDPNESNKKIQIISKIVLPPKIKVKGRPKGADETVIGLKRKRNKK
ncbi:uncharacterized protein LOC126888734 [Diabrotica virgifera virgifera]|uniref:SWIM-type domain-containing protein n=2 Tax=Diabrotica virgifera virgifera TaxID=50390 RepID=A0ABM5KSD0_DIAVI|nr:uncharacterized protein LOC126888734 [Diabrotica virgifera virgifera]